MSDPMNPTLPTPPRHVAIIMDGNGRWAVKQGNSRIYGHYNGKLPVRESIEAAIELGVRYLTLYAFSTENWRRPTEEVNALMDLLATSITEELDELVKERVELRTIGDLTLLPLHLQDSLDRAKRATRHGDRLTLIVALNYGGQQEIVRAARRMAEEALAQRLRPEEIDADRFEEYLDTAGVPPPELLIRTGGELRLSNFLLWQSAYAEFLFLPLMWPEFRKEHFRQAVQEFYRRTRRFGAL